VGLEDLDPAQYAEVDPRLDVGLKAALSPDAAVAARRGFGGTAPERVAEQLHRLRERMDEHRAWAQHYHGPRL
jgi:argininosuccinate lyase